ncbi:thioredoxin-like superfamily protein isoform X2 [Solanum lycopersicum]|uniref:thioredoxin-like superfamily protein isoform X2 n=1 Tax=Solanum lycopersicum TaxID=4081 RepID=UPI0008FEC5DA|nr:thioredoxin-like superfamily protein isoform X3 [Solanum lycopersicum]XP_025887077.1 thioredoxin-like superfamily protein isoform X3 [Solanum lycopersicum]
MDYILRTLTKKEEVDSIIRDTIDKVLVLRLGRSSDPLCLQLDDILYKSVREVSKFATVALVDIDSEDVRVYVKYFDITLIPSTIFFFNAHHMKMDSGSYFSKMDILQECRSHQVGWSISEKTRLH